MYSDAVNAPLGIIFSVVGLYAILGYSSLAGLGFLSASYRPLTLAKHKTDPAWTSS